MKKQILGLLLFLTLLTLLCVSASAYADKKSGDFEYEVLDDGTAKLMKYFGSETDLVIPEKIDGYTISAIYEHFSLSEPVKELISITIPDTLTSIEPGAFNFCKKLTNIIISRNHPTLTFIDGVLYNKEHKSILIYLQSNTAEHFDIPDGIKQIEEDAFYFSCLVSVNIPGSVEHIDERGFSYSNKLKEINLSEGLKSIDRAAINSDSLEQITLPASLTDLAEENFSLCGNLKEIRVAAGNPVFTVVDGALINKRDGILLVFPKQSPLESYKIPEGIYRIADFAFNRCCNIKSISFPESLTEIGRFAFSYCEQLTAFDLPDGITKIELEGVANCRKVQYLHIPAGLSEIDHNFSALGIQELIIPETVTSIGGSFCNLDNVTNIVIPNSVTSIGANSFTHCHNLTSITIPASVMEIGDAAYMFLNCPETIVIRVEKGSYAEQYCKENNFKYEYIGERTVAPAANDDPSDWLKKD